MTTQTDSSETAAEAHARRGMTFEPPSGTAGPWDVAPVEAWPGPPGGGLRHWLSLIDIDLTAAHPTWLVRTVEQAVDPSGVQAVSSYALVYDPTFQRLIIHWVRVIRDGEVREVAMPEAVELLRREPDLERARFDGRLTAHLSVPDVRVGDVLDAAYSIVGGHPALKGWFTAGGRFTWRNPVAKTVLRIHAPAGRRFAVRRINNPPEGSVRREGAVDIHEWSAVQRLDYLAEAETPPWVIDYDAVMVSDEGTWAEVAALFSPLYAVDPADLAGLAGTLDALRPLSAAEQIVRALAVVQDEIRYQAISIGDGGFRPREVGRVWSERLGDCKDKTRLLTGILQALGIEAVPALVNTTTGFALADEPPTPTAFDHCLARVRLEGRTYWLDPTLQTQGGTLDVLVQARFGWALPLVPDAVLEGMGEEPRRVEARFDETWTIPPTMTAATRMEARTTLSGWRADAQRHELRSAGVARVAERLRLDLEKSYGAVTAIGDLMVEDDLATNVVVIDGRYDMPRFASRDVRAGTSTLAFAADLGWFTGQFAETGSRRQPFYLGPPFRMHVTRTVHLPVSVSGSWDDYLGAPGVGLHSILQRKDSRTVRADLDLDVRERILPADQADTFHTFLHRARYRDGLVIPMRVRGVGFISGRRDRLGGRPTLSDFLTSLRIPAVVLLFLLLLALAPYLLRR